MPVSDAGSLEGLKFLIVGARDAEAVIKHVGMLAEDAAISIPQTGVPVLHCQPPIEVGVAPGGQVAPIGSMPCDVVAWMELTTTQRHGMETWITRMRTMISQSPPNQSMSERRFREYVVHPFAEDVRDDDDSIQYRRFSCVGFVFACYDEGAQVVLVDTSDMPTIDLPAISEMFGFDMAVLERFGARFGLTGNGPWPVLLPSYLFHALVDDARPLRPTAGHCRLMPGSALRADRLEQ